MDSTPPPSSHHHPQEPLGLNSIPLGGPIYNPDLIGPLTRVGDFEASLMDQLQTLKAQLCVDSSQLCEDDLSVEELKIFSEEELVDKAMKEAFQDHENSQNELPELPIQLRNDNQLNSISETAHLETSRKEGDLSTNNECVNGTLIEVDNGGYPSELTKISRQKKKKRGRKFDRDTRAAELEGSYIAKVEYLANIKKKQDEDKAAARLHSFNGSCQTGKSTSSQSENIGRMTSLRSLSSSKKVKLSSLHEHIPVSYPEVVLCVEIYRCTKTWLKTQEFLVLGTQTLTALRDQIYCLTDQLMQKAGQRDPSGYFLIEDVFCNDMRDPSAINYSEPIFEWLRDSKDEALKKWEWILSGQLQQKRKEVFGEGTHSRLPNFRDVKMHEVRFCDLQFRLGARYLYCHQGDCKHPIVIRDMRLIHPEDVQNRAAYPVLSFQLKSRISKCNVCNIYRATKVTVDDKWAKENPCYFCDNCYYLLHYNEDGTLLYDEFSVYDYHHD